MSFVSSHESIIYSEAALRFSNQHQSMRLNAEN